MSDEAAEEPHWNIIPFVRAAATDLNFTVALALISVVMTQVYGMRAQGMKYWSKFFTWPADRMAKNPLAVLDPDCRVRGIDRLRVVDSSMFPTITNGNLNAPTIAAAERAADLIRGRPAETSPAEYWIDERWQERQRPGEPRRPGLCPDQETS